jgi:hypothetical protein
LLFVDAVSLDSSCLVSPLPFRLMRGATLLSRRCVEPSSSDFAVYPPFPPLSRVFLHLVFCIGSVSSRAAWTAVSASDSVGSTSKRNTRTVALRPFWRERAGRTISFARRNGRTLPCPSIDVMVRTFRSFGSLASTKTTLPLLSLPSFTSPHYISHFTHNNSTTMLFTSFAALSLLPAAFAAPFSRRNYSNATAVETCSLALNQSVTSQIRHSIDTRSAWVPQQNDDGEYTTIEVVRSFSFSSLCSLFLSGDEADSTRVPAEHSRHYGPQPHSFLHLPN